MHMPAPIVLFVYNRPHFTRQTLEALTANELAEQSELFIFSDGWKDGATDQEIEKVKAVRALLKEKNWCKTVTIIEAEKNKGLATSVIDGVTEIVNRYGNIIVIEDDVVTSKYFLRFMNDALNKYAHEERVLSAGSWNYYFPCGYSDTFFTNLPDTIAWATWKRAWDQFEPDAKKLMAALYEQKKINEFNIQGNFNFEDMLNKQIQNKVSSWAIRWTAVAVLKDTLTLYPARSLSKHIGFGNDSTHVKSPDYNADLQLAASPIQLSDIPLVNNREAVSNWVRFEKEVIPLKLSAKKRFLFTLKNFLHTLARRVRINHPGWSGNYLSWTAAKNKCEGYDAVSILNKVKEATLKVKKGEAACERDSVVFDEVQYSYPLLYSLRNITAACGNKLQIVDFGGALGSSYFQNRILFAQAHTIKWSVVEQPDFVKTGNDLIADERLSFYNTIAEAKEKKGEHDVLLLSCVLPYLEKPYEFLEEIIPAGFKYIIIENTYFNPGKKDRLTIQKVSPSIYEASYPAWFLNYEKVRSILKEKYTVQQEYMNESFLYLDGKKVQYRGVIFKLKNENHT
jgi:putative methyltransferase (TIGR04325 family)